MLFYIFWIALGVIILFLVFVRRSNKTIPNKRNLKLMIIVNTDLNMSNGKIISQACHAVSETIMNAPKDILHFWRKNGQAKIVVKATQSEINEIIKKCRMNNILYNNIFDAGRTEVKPGSNTVLAVGPESSDLLKGITGHLKLL